MSSVLEKCRPSRHLNRLHGRRAPRSETPYNISTPLSRSRDPSPAKTEGISAQLKIRPLDRNPLAGGQYFVPITRHLRSGPRNSMNRRELIDKSTWGMRRKRGANFMRKKLGLIVGAAALFSATPLLAQRGDEPVAVPRTIKQGIDFVYVDPDMNNVARRHQRPQNWFQRILSFDFAGGRSGAPNVLFAQLGAGCSSTRRRTGACRRTNSRRPGAQAGRDRQAGATPPSAARASAGRRL